MRSGAWPSSARSFATVAVIVARAGRQLDRRKVVLDDGVLIGDPSGAWARFLASIPLARVFARDGWIVIDLESARR